MTQSPFLRVLLSALVVVALACAGEREPPPEEKDVPVQTAPVVAEPAPARDPVDTVVPPSEPSAEPLPPECASFDDAVRSSTAYAAVHVARNGSRTPGGTFTFRTVGGVLQGEVRSGGDGAVRSRALDYVHHQVATDSLFFWYESGGGVRDLYRLQVSCGELQGTARLFVTEENSVGTLVDAVLTPTE